jgi:hypothetical protein
VSKVQPKVSQGPVEVENNGFEPFSVDAGLPQELILSFSRFLFPCRTGARSLL